MTLSRRIRRRASGVLLDWSRKVHPNASGHGKGLFGNEKDIPVPPRSLLVGPADAFVDVALTTMGRMIMAGLRPEHDVLDIGCGVGRTARYLCGFLEDRARYEGFDVREDLVAWCQSNITPRFRNFHFQVAALFNSNYRPDPSLPSAAQFTFPYPDRSFDFVFAHSMFTHLQPDVSNNYLREIHRVLRPGGISYTTWVLINDDDPSLFAHATQKMQRDPSGTFAVRRVTDPDALVAYTEQFVRGAHSSSGLSIVEPVHPGFSLQDVVVAVK